MRRNFGRITDNPTPIVESTGSGGGMKIFCAGVGKNHPDISYSSRRTKQKEYVRCQENGAADIVEVIVGYDRIFVANAMDGAVFDFGIEHLVIALAANGPLPTTWNEVDPLLPPLRVEILGPPPSTGTRDAFEELLIHKVCEDTNLVECEAVSMRKDGVYVDAGENDKLIVSKLETNPNALGIFRFSFLDQNSKVIKGAIIDGVEPTFDNIADGEYIVSRSLYFYVKSAHVDLIPGLEEFLEEFVPEASADEDSHLADNGLFLWMRARLRELPKLRLA